MKKLEVEKILDKLYKILQEEDCSVADASFLLDLLKDRLRHLQQGVGSVDFVELKRVKIIVQREK